VTKRKPIVLNGCVNGESNIQRSISSSKESQKPSSETRPWLPMGVRIQNVHVVVRVKKPFSALTTSMVMGERNAIFIALGEEVQTSIGILESWAFLRGIKFFATTAILLSILEASALTKTQNERFI